MAYNRMSQQFHGSQHNRNRKKEDVNDALMRLVSFPVLVAGLSPRLPLQRLTGITAR